MVFENIRCWFLTVSIRVANLCYADSGGGAALGAQRLHKAFRSQGVDSKLYVIKKLTDDDTVVELPVSQLRRRLARQIGRLMLACQRSENPIVRTLNVFPSGAGRFLNSLDCDVIQMHWIGSNTISIGEIGRLNKPVVWKLPDMWAFCGSEHYLLPDDVERFADGYSSSNRQTHDRGLDIDRLVWRYKRKQWRGTNLSIAGPSRWITACASRSKLFAGARIRHIFNPLDTDHYAPRDRNTARDRFGLPHRKQLIAFGAMNATSDPRKGYAYLRQAMAHLEGRIDTNDLAFVVIGSVREEPLTQSGFTVYSLGTIDDEDALIDVYNAVDGVVVPSQADNLPNVVKEATCCGIACAGFDVGGMPDMIEHQHTGYLATPFEPTDLAAGIIWLLEHTSEQLRDDVRRRAVARHARRAAVEQYLDYYREILSVAADG